MERVDHYRDEQRARDDQEAAEDDALEDGPEGHRLDPRVGGVVRHAEGERGEDDCCRLGQRRDPDQPEQWAYLSKYSPYQNVKAEVDYPRAFFTTSTRDDRVHPGHARKMVAKMLDQGHDLLYYENIEGGHGGAANLKQAAFLNALIYAYLHGQLADQPEA